MADRCPVGVIRSCDISCGMILVRAAYHDYHINAPNILYKTSECLLRASVYSKDALHDVAFAGSPDQGTLAHLRRFL